MHRKIQAPNQDHTNRSIHAHWEGNNEEKENVSCHSNRRQNQQKRKDSKMPLQLEKEVRGRSPSNDKRQEYLRNEGKIEKLSCKLEELYQHFQQKSRKFQQKKQKVGQLKKIQAENIQLQQDIKKVRQLLKVSLLQEEKAKLALHFTSLN